MGGRRAARLVVGALLLLVGGAVADDRFLDGDFPHDAFDRLPSTRLAVGGATLSVAFAPGEITLPRATVLAWVSRCATAVATYFGRFPVPSARVLIVPASSVGVHGGKTWGMPSAASRMTLGRATMKAQLDADWVLVHELTHYGFPEVADAQHWMEEGLATYVEPIARRQIGDLSDAKVWGDLVAGLPQGLPAAGDRGLDRTPTWGRTYWGGALFYLLADVEIRERTDNRRGLQDALRALTAAGGNITRRWPATRVLAVADAGTGTHVLEELYGRMKDEPGHVDLADLWRRLGVVVDGDTVRFDEAAPLAAIRRAITAPPLTSASSGRDRSRRAPG